MDLLATQILALLLQVGSSAAAVPQTQTAQASTVRQAPAARIQVWRAPAAASAAHADSTPAAPTAPRRLSAKIKLQADSGWTRTGLVLAPGDTLTSTAGGKITIDSLHETTADGLARGWRDLLRQYPAEGQPVGALIGRIGDSAAAVPFVLGAKADIPVRQAGELWVRTNLATQQTATGTLEVKLSATTSTTTSTTSTSTAANSSSPAAASARSQLRAETAITAEVFDALPRRVEDQDHNPGDVVNFALIGTEQQVRSAFTAAGWVAVDSDVQSAVLHGVLSTLARKPYLEMPMSTLYLFDRPQDMSWARAQALTVAAQRHHLRVWNSGQTLGGQPLWVGSATFDNGFERDQRNGKLTHSIDPEIDKERDFLRDSFYGAGSTVWVAYFTPDRPVTSANTATGGSFHSDGRVLVLLLRGEERAK